MLGFMPGFAYLGTCRSELATLPRRATPRARVPAGAVAIAGRPDRHLPGRHSGRLAPDRPHVVAAVRSRARPAGAHPARRSRAFRGRGRAPPGGNAAGSAPLFPGRRRSRSWRPGCSRRSRTRAGPGAAASAWAPRAPWIERACRAANRAARQSPRTRPCSSARSAGPRFGSWCPIHFAVAGADLGAVLHRADLGAWPVPAGVRVRARAGNVLAFTGPPRRLPRVPGGRRRDRRPRGARIAIHRPGGRLRRARRPAAACGRPSGASGRRAAAADLDGPAAPSAGRRGISSTLRVIPGPQDDHFTRGGPAPLLHGGVPRRLHLGPRRLPSRRPASRARRRVRDRVGRHAAGLHPGPAGRKPDRDGRRRPTTGGYPKIATVIRADVPRWRSSCPARAACASRPASVRALSLPGGSGSGPT